MMVLEIPGSSRHCFRPRGLQRSGVTAHVVPANEDRLPALTTNFESPVPSHLPGANLPLPHLMFYTQFRFLPSHVFMFFHKTSVLNVFQLYLPATLLLLTSL